MASPARLQKLIRLFSSGGLAAGESVAYNQSMLRRPETVDPWPLPSNSCSFIGSVSLSVRRFRKSDDAYTFLEVKTPSRDSDRYSSFQILLAMKNELAERSLEYLKPNDVIYVSGHLGSYEKADVSGKRQVFYKLAVEDLNYIKCTDQNQTLHKHETTRMEELRASISCALDQERACSSDSLDNERKCRDRLHLWQIFFSSPYEWWDNRQRKKNPRGPDFRHKDTNECLWIDSSDPPWVRKQLELYDQMMTAGLLRNPGGRSSNHKWKLTDFSSLSDSLDKIFGSEKSV